MNNRAMMGAALCAAGVVFTFVVKTGFIWYGAIIWGGVMFVQGMREGS